MTILVKKRTLFHLAVIALLLALAIVAGKRDLSIGADTPGYARQHLEQASCRCFTGMEVGYEALTFPTALLNLSTAAHFTYLSACIFLLTFIAFIRLGEPPTQGAGRLGLYVTGLLGMYGIFLINPLYLQMHINAIRNGLSALAVLLFAIGLVKGRSWKHLLFWGVSSVLLHWSALMYLPFASLAGRRVRKSTQIALIVLLHGLLFSYLSGLSQSAVHYLSPMLYDFVFSYGESALQRYGFGPRPDFALFTYFLAMGGIAAARIVDPTKKTPLSAFANVAAATTFPFFILGWGVFSNRYLLTPWVMFSALAAALFARSIAPSRWGPIVAPLLFLAGVGVFLSGLR